MILMLVCTWVRFSEIHFKLTFLINSKAIMGADISIVHVVNFMKIDFPQDLKVVLLIIYACIHH